MGPDPEGFDQEMLTPTVSPAWKGPLPPGNVTFVMLGLGRDRTVRFLVAEDDCS